MSNLTKMEIVEKLAQCLGVEKASETIENLCSELGFPNKNDLSNDEIIKLCERLEQEGGFMKMMASVLKIQALMETSTV